MKRKEFIKSASAVLALGVLPDVSANEQTTNYNPINWKNTDIDFNNIRQYFKLDPTRVFLNNGTIGPTSIPVLEKLAEVYDKIATSGYYPQHTDALEAKIGKLIGAEKKEIGITKNVTESINIVANGIKFKKGDEILITNNEHVGGAVPWINRAKNDKLKLKSFALGKTADETIENYKKAITKKTRVIAIPHIPCTNGQVLPIKEMCAIAKSKGIITSIDGAHPLGMILFNVKEIGCDYYSGCLHKWMLGPVGTGYIFINENNLQNTKTLMAGAYSVADFGTNINNVFMSEIINEASRYSYGTFNGPAREAAETAIDFYNKIGPEKIENRVKELNEYLYQQLKTLGNAVEFVSPEEKISRAAQVSIRLKSLDNQNKLVLDISEKAKTTLRYVGENKINCIRISTHYYNTEAEINGLIQFIENYKP